MKTQATSRKFSSSGGPNKRSLGRRLASDTGLTVAVVFLALPIAWGILTALKPEADAFDTSLSTLLHATEFNNFVAAWNYGPFGRFLLNGLIVAVGGTLLTVATCLMAGYAFARLHFRGRDSLFFVYIATLVIPQEVLVVPMYLFMRDLGLGQQLPSAHRPVGLQRLWRVPHEAVFPDHPLRARGCSQGGRGIAFLHLPQSDGTHGPPRDGSARPVHVYLLLEQLSLAPNNNQQPKPGHGASGPRVLPDPTGLHLEPLDGRGDNSASPGDNPGRGAAALAFRRYFPLRAGRSLSGTIWKVDVMDLRMRSSL